MLQRLFPTFPGGWPGVALLLLRVVFAAAMLVQGVNYLVEAASGVAVWIIGLVTIASCSLLLIGFLTPLAGAVVGLAAIGTRLSLTQALPPTLFDSPVSVAFAAAILVAIIILGPGSLSVDARVFGRREIIFPPLSRE